MKIFDTGQIKEIDRYTIINEPVSSIELMERAAGACVEWIAGRFPTDRQFLIYCGPGNNGGDGLAIARLLHDKKYKNIKVVIPNTGIPFSADMNINLERLAGIPEIPIIRISPGMKLPVPDKGQIVIDALFGSGLSRPLEGLYSELVDAVNQSGCHTISIDMPGGLYGEDNTSNIGRIIKANDTITLQFPKRAFFYSENACYTGSWHIVDIGLHPEAIKATPANFFYLSREDISLKKREKFSHKGTFGNALLIAGSYGMTGASILAARACYASGAGLVTCHVPANCYPIVQVAVPEAVFSIDRSDSVFTAVEDYKNFSAVGVGPGIGTSNETADALEELIENTDKPVVIDADALNIISLRKSILGKLRPESILTPHPREFDRLFGECKSGFQRNMKQIEMAVKYRIIVVLKGAYTSVALPDGRCFFNSTGNPGMATAGSGDVLTGVILALITQGYDPADAAVTGPWIHGLAGDIAASVTGQTALTASIIVDNIGPAFKTIEV